MVDKVNTEQLLAEISDYWNKRPDSNMYKLVDLYNNTLNDITDDLNKVNTWRALSEAEGTTLDLIGADEQASRVTKSDDAYRFWIWIKYLMARAQGTYPSFVKIGKSSLGTDKGFDIWKTGIRHVGVQIPYNLIPDLPTNKLIVENLQNMLALGYWIGEIHLPVDIEGTLHAGTLLTTDQKQYSNQKATWWEGWQADINGVIHLGATQSTKEYETREAIWWRGWSATVDGALHAGAVGDGRDSFYLVTPWWQGYSSEQNTVAHVGIRGHANVRTIYNPQKAAWWSSWSDKNSTTISVGAANSSDELTRKEE